jgi:hypothetical protein
MNWLDNLEQYKWESQDIFSLPIFSEETQRSNSTLLFSRDALSLECESRINWEINRILQKISEKELLETKELQIYSLYATMELLQSDQEQQKTKYRIIIKEILDFRWFESNLD